MLERSEEAERLERAKLAHQEAQAAHDATAARLQTVETALAHTTSLMASRLIPMTTRTPWRSDSSRRSEIPSIRLSCANSAICSTRRALFT